MTFKKYECRAGTTFDIQKIKLQQIDIRHSKLEKKNECRAGTIFDIRHSKVEKKSHGSGTTTYRRISNRVCRVYYEEHLGLQALVTGVEQKKKNTMEWNTFIFFLTGVEQRP